MRRYGCTVVGLDQSAEMLDGARARLAREPAPARSGSRSSPGEAERLPFADGEFDHLTFTYLLRYVDDPAATLRELARVVRPGGRIASLEFGVPGRAGLARAVDGVHARRAARARPARLARVGARPGAFLARSIPEFYERHPRRSELRRAVVGRPGSASRARPAA